MTELNIKLKHKQYVLPASNGSFWVLSSARLNNWLNTAEVLLQSDHYPPDYSRTPLFEMYKTQVNFQLIFSGWEVLKKLAALSSGLCFILLHAVKSVNNSLSNNQFVYPVNCEIDDIKAILRLYLRAAGFSTRHWTLNGKFIILR